MSFFDDSENSSGSLAARLTNDPEDVKSLAGPNLGTLTVVGVGLISSVIFSLIIGWKLALVACFGALPFIFGAGLVNERMEESFEKVASKTFESSNSFASECVSAIKTVSSLAMENLVDERYGALLVEHGRRTQRYAFRAMCWFALSESIDLLCMALTFWYVQILNEGNLTDHLKVWRTTSLNQGI
jgi:ATP-binding cassette subfamily B (MDR/TAP) protein 1